MTDHNFDHFGYRKPVAEHLADAAAAVGDTAPPPDPATLNFDPVEVTPNMWQLPHETGTNRFFRTNAEARRAAITAEANARREYANYVNAQPVPVRSRGQEVSDAYEAARAQALSEGVTPEAWKYSAEVRAEYMPDMRDGHELWRESKSKRA